MGAYTAEGIAEREEDPNGGDEPEIRSTPSPKPKESLPKSLSSSPRVPHTPTKSSPSGVTSPHTPRWVLDVDIVVIGLGYLFVCIHYF